MANNDIAQKLALLPEVLAERNIKSWNDMVKLCEKPVDAMIAEHFSHPGNLYPIVYAFSMDQQAKLFRAGEKAYSLIISTSESQELKSGEPFLNVDIVGGFLTVRYAINEPDTVPYATTERSNIKIKVVDFGEGEKMNLSQYNIMTALQPMLNLLWDETRGKNNAHRDRINFNL